MRRHQNDTKTFAELNYREQAQAINIAAVQFRKMINANLRLAETKGLSLERVLRTRLGLLERIIQDYQTP